MTVTVPDMTAPILSAFSTALGILWPFLLLVIVLKLLFAGKRKGKRGGWRKGKAGGYNRMPPSRLSFQSSQPFQPSRLSPTEKGEEGEMAVYHALAAFTEERGFYRYHNLILPDDKGGTTEIDSVMFSRFGIFVFEIKNYEGWIFGKTEDDKWTQMLNKRSKTPFQNPLRQNYKHIAALRDITGLPESCFCSVVVFAGDAEFKTPMPDNVVYWRDVAGCVSATAENILLSDEQVSNAISAVMNSQNKKPNAAEKHRDYVREMHR